MTASVRHHVRLAGVASALLAGVFGIGALVSAGGGLPHDDLTPDSDRLQFNLTPQPTPAPGAEVTPSPTPRVIVIPTSTPGAVPATTAPPAATSTPQSIVIVEPAATTVSTSTPVPTPVSTPTSVPTAIPTATPPPPPIVPGAAPTVAPSQAIRLDFTAQDWSGGYYRGDGQAYGRPWVAVYGALSDFPSATLIFTLDTTPGAPGSLSITGLDDEMGSLNPVALTVNGQPVFEGPSPFLNWDGSGSGENAAWTAVPFTIPRGILRSGQNEITFANLIPVASFNAPPYVLLADASLEIPGGAASANPPPIVPSEPTAAFTAEDWSGGFYRGDSVFYGRPWTAIYGSASDYPRATLRFRITGEATGPAMLTVAGLDDELTQSNPIAIEINGQPVFEGPSPFQNWDGIGNGDNAAWTNVEITIPANLLRSGRNDVAIANLSPGANFSAPPYVLLGDATLQVPGAEVSARAGNDAPRQEDD